MKPREFDELVRQKFEQNDFAYNPHSWDRLAEQMDGRAKKRSMLMWLWMPAAGMAASVALALGITSLLKMGIPATGNTNAGYANVGKWQPREVVAQSIAMIPYTPQPATAMPQKQAKKTKSIIRPVQQPVASAIGIKLNNVIPDKVQPKNEVVVAAATPAKTILPARKKEIADQQPLHTFRQEVHAMKKPMNLSVIVMGGVCQGNRNSGYMAGATVRKMINDKVYVESDIAFATSDNTQQTMYMDYGDASMPGAGTGATAAKPASASKTTSVTNTDKTPVTTSPTGVAKMKDVSYNLYYAQITPSIGYKIMKRMSVGLGPDFQKMLIDNRPATSEVDRGNLQVAPTFDVGFVGKTEYALTQRVRAGVSYRKGINGVINLSDKYIDRDYIQFQMRCTIFNR
jgi:hypothetical protein